MDILSSNADTMIHTYRMKNRFLINLTLITAILLIDTQFLFSQSIRNNNQNYFNSIQWEENQPLHNTALPEPFRIETQNPIPYGDIASEQAVYPSLDMLGVLDYQNIAEDILVFLDGIASAFAAKQIDASLCVPKKPFLPYLFGFLLTDTPDVTSVFYGRPIFKHDGSIVIEFKIIFNKQTDSKNEASGRTKTDTYPWSYIIKVEAVKQESIWYVSGISIQEIESKPLLEKAAGQTHHKYTE